jgi:hypothetical protein
MDRFVSSPESLHLAWRHGASHVRENHCQDDAMLVDVVEAMELPECVAIASLVWLETVDRFYRLLPHALYFSSKAFPVFIGGIKNWESRLGVRKISCDGDQLTGQVIQRATQILQSIAHEEREFLGHGADIRDAKTDFSRLFVYLSDNGVGVANPELLPCRLEVLDVLIGPIEFGKNSWIR